MNKYASFTLAFLLGSFPLCNTACSDFTPTESSTEIQLTSDVQLFVDDFLIERMEGVWRTLNRPTKFPRNPIVKPDRPWEGYLVLQPGTVIFDEEDQLFKMWYNTIATRRRPYVEQFLCYATSVDGITWEKPDLDLVEFRGSKSNNILLKWSNWTHCVIKDGADPDSNRRYKLAYWQTQDRSKCGVWAAFSSDGVHWTNYPDNPVVPCWATGDTFSVMQDPISGQFFLYHKTISRPIRKVSRLVSDDFIHWRDSRQVLEPDQWDQPDTEFYGLSAFSYGGQYLGLLWIYHTYLQQMDVQLVSSRDGLHWERAVHRRRFIPLLPDGGYTGDTFDSGMIYPTSAPVIKDNQLWIYYSGFTNLHNAPSSDHNGQIGLGRMRLDGFVSLDATSEGYVLTRPLTIQGSSLWANFEPMTAGGSGEALHSQLFANNSEGMGYLRVEIQDEQGQPIPGYEASRSRPTQEQGIYQKISWEGDRDLSALKDQKIRFKFVMSNAKLYSFKLP